MPKKTSLIGQFKRVLHDTAGISAIEYGLLASFVALAASQALSAVGVTFSDTFADTASRTSNAESSISGTARPPGSEDLASGTDPSEPSVAAGGVSEEPSTAAADVPVIYTFEPEEPSVAAGMISEAPVESSVSGFAPSEPAPSSRDTGTSNSNANSNAGGNGGGNGGGNSGRNSGGGNGGGNSGRNSGGGNATEPPVAAASDPASGI